MSALGDHLGAAGSAAFSNEFFRVQPQILRKVLHALVTAVRASGILIGEARLLEPRFTRQLAACFEDARDATGGVRYHIEHQGELLVRDDQGRVIGYRRLDIRVLFTQQVGRRGDYLCIECKYLDAADRATDADYVDEGVHRIVSGAYALGHSFAIMVGLERSGPLARAIAHVDDRLRERYGSEQGLRAARRWKIDAVHESEHPQSGGPHRITIVHSFFALQSNVA